MNFTKIKKILREDNHWPNKKVFVVEMEENGKTFESTITPAEKKIYLQFLALKGRGKLSDDNIEALCILIDDYGQEKYEEGSFDAEQTEDL